MKYLLDTDICVFFLRGNDAVVSQIATINERDLAISIITLAELQFGAYHSAHVADNLERVSFFNENTQLVSLTPEITTEYARLKADLRRSGATIADFDLLIAATAKRHNLVLVTNNIKHFDRIEGLTLANWVEEEQKEDAAK